MSADQNRNKQRKTFTLAPKTSQGLRRLAAKKTLEGEEQVSMSEMIDRLVADEVEREGMMQ